MSFIVLLIIIGLVSAGLTFVITKMLKIQKSIIVSFLQFFFGLLYLVSGFVKAVDPLGTSYKMEEYFQEFQNLFEPTWFSFLNPMFKAFETNSIGFAIFIILLELIVGVMLIIGYRPKLAAWLFFLTMAFFTILTGYTYLTGYVPIDASFFQFSKWGEYADTNMRVTDCGCFGDFIKFSAWHTFLKDAIMLIPAIYLIFRSSSMHQLFKPFVRWTLFIVSLVGFYFFCLSNYKWDLPMINFRPFKEGVNIREQKKAEMEAMANIQEKAIKLRNRNSGEIVEIPTEQYNATEKNYPKENWEILDRIFTKPVVPKTEISDFVLEDFEGNDMTDKLLSDPQFSFMIVSWKMPSNAEPVSLTFRDTTYIIDTVKLLNSNTNNVIKDSIRVIKTIDTVTEKTINTYNYIWDKEFLSDVVKNINPLVEKAQKDKISVFYAVSATQEMVDDFKKDGGPNIPYYNSDDITLKTVIRSNPGILLLRNGEIIKEWHFRKLPDYDTIKRSFMYGK